MTPIAYRDPSGFVTPVITNAVFSDDARAALTPLYTQEEIDAANAEFEQRQKAESAKYGYVAQPFTDDSAEQLAVAEAEAVRKTKSYTGQSIAEAAAAALGVPKAK